MITEISNTQFDNVKMGTRIRLEYGAGYPSVFGKVYGRIRSRFGDALRVKLDDFTFTTIHGFTTIGVGAYLVEEPRMLINGFTVEQLDAAFNAICNPEDWKDEIIATMPGEHVALAVEAIKYYTATIPTVKVSVGAESMTYIVYSQGYRAGPAGDH